MPRAYEISSGACDVTTTACGDFRCRVSQGAAALVMYIYFLSSLPGKPPTKTPLCLPCFFRIIILEADIVTEDIQNLVWFVEHYIYIKKASAQSRNIEQKKKKTPPSASYLWAFFFTVLRRPLSLPCFFILFLSLVLFFCAFLEDVCL